MTSLQNLLCKHPHIAVVFAVFIVAGCMTILESSGALKLQGSALPMYGVMPHTMRSQSSKAGSGSVRSVIQRLHPSAGSASSTRRLRLFRK